MKKFIHGERQVWAYALFSVFISFFITAGFNIWFTVKVAEENNQKFCDIVTTFVEANRGRPTQSTTQQKVAVEMSKLQKELKC